LDSWTVDVAGLDEAGANSLAEFTQELGFETLIANPEEWYFWILDRRSAKAIADLLRAGVASPRWDRGADRRLQIEDGLIDDLDDWLKTSRQSSFKLPGDPVGGRRSDSCVLTPLGMPEQGAHELVGRAAQLGYDAVALSPDEWWIAGYGSAADRDRALQLGLAADVSAGAPEDLRKMVKELAASMAAWQETIATSDWD
jgi:hypothetical protein